MLQQSNNLSSTMKNHSNTASQKENDCSLKPNLKVMKYCDTTDRELKRTVMKKVNKSQENKQANKKSSMS